MGRRMHLAGTKINAAPAADFIAETGQRSRSVAIAMRRTTISPSITVVGRIVAYLATNGYEGLGFEFGEAS